MVNFTRPHPACSTNHGVGLYQPRIPSKAQMVRCNWRATLPVVSANECNQAVCVAILLEQLGAEVVFASAWNLLTGLSN